MLGGIRITDDAYAKVLDDLMLLDDILACMVASKNMISIEPSGGTNSFKPEVYEIWDEVKRTMDIQLSVVNQISGYDKMNAFIREYEVLLYVLPDTSTALVAIVPGLSNRGLIDVEMERARQKIQQMMEKADEA